ncbi:END3 [Cyberlindnera jadinii]|uniref:Actin cytoskeleton-regulatory complex protein END3 n=1 Tax=Cyberlindnera jadinii (strain ATCC 18201 / CBS 1600 / BCRC 20928 / JCM 3617 / NBRC 0987 / NRRL Y-1542) TaxID=983966 RepID=A0A0H5C0C9_CYBJN|nr:END3 [Cyberlindnera jadinii]
MPKLEQSEIKKYWEIFSGLKPVDNKLSGDKVAVVLKNSKLSDDNLGKIWDLADIDADGQLDFEEFCICMRLIFDLVNQNMTVLPSQLPDWLIPSSKAHLIQANRALNGQDQSQRYSDSEDEDLTGAQFDWYISPGDKATYEQIYSTMADRFGRITFDSLGGLLSTLTNVADQDARFAWNLVNPRSSETIDKDQALVLLHMLNQRDSGKQMPRGVPPALRATFNKEQPEYSLDSHQATISQPQPASKHTFAENYLERIGGSGLAKNTKGTDFSSTQGTDWEEVRLKRELTDLEEKVAKAEAATESKKKERANGQGTTAQVRRELEQLLEYKQKQLISDSNSSSDLAGVASDVDTVESQVKVLEQYLEKKKAEYADLQNQIAQAKSS